MPRRPSGRINNEVHTTRQTAKPTKTLLFVGIVSHKYLDFVREPKKLRNVKVMVILIVNGALGMIAKDLAKGLEDLEIRGRVETIQTTALLRLVRILRRVLETCSHSYSSERPPAKAGVKDA